MWPQTLLERSGTYMKPLLTFLDHHIADSIPLYVCLEPPYFQTYVFCTKQWSIQYNFHNSFQNKYTMPRHRRKRASKWALQIEKKISPRVKFSKKQNTAQTGIDSSIGDLPPRKRQLSQKKLSNYWSADLISFTAPRMNCRMQARKVPFSADTIPVHSS